MFTAYQILLRELVAHGHTTYAALAARYEAHGYTRATFAQAVMKARRQGIVTGDGGKGKPIVKAGACPCCGRPL